MRQSFKDAFPSQAFKFYLPLKWSKGKCSWKWANPFLQVSLAHKPQCDLILVLVLWVLSSALQRAMLRDALLGRHGWSLWCSLGRGMKTFYNDSVSPPQTPGLVWKASIVWALGKNIDTPWFLLQWNPLLDTKEKSYRVKTRFTGKIPNE